MHTFLPWRAQSLSREKVAALTSGEPAAHCFPAHHHRHGDKPTACEPAQEKEEQQQQQQQKCCTEHSFFQRLKKRRPCACAAPPDGQALHTKEQKSLRRKRTSSGLGRMQPGRGIRTGRLAGWQIGWQAGWGVCLQSRQMQPRRKCPGPCVLAGWQAPKPTVPM